MVKKFGLEGEPGPVRDYEQEAFSMIALDCDGERACNMLELWALENIDAQYLSLIHI